MQGNITHKLSITGLWEVEIHHGINEHLDFPEVPDPVKRVYVDLGEVGFMNSSGLRRWVGWVEKIISVTPPIEATIGRVPLLFIRNAHAIREVLPAQIKVESFFVNYYCTICNTGKRLLLRNHAGISFMAENCSTCQRPLETELPDTFYQNIVAHAPKV